MVNSRRLSVRTSSEAVDCYGGRRYNNGGCGKEYGRFDGNDKAELDDSDGDGRRLYAASVPEPFPRYRSGDGGRAKSIETARH